MDGRTDICKYRAASLLQRLDAEVSFTVNLTIRTRQAWDMTRPIMSIHTMLRQNITVAQLLCKGNYHELRLKPFKTLWIGIFSDGLLL